MVKVFHTRRNFFLPVFLALAVFVYPMLVRAACPCPEMILSTAHTQIHNQQPDSQNVVEQKPCHGGHAATQSTPVAERPAPKKQNGCCNVRAADFEFFKMDLSLTVNQLKLENKFLQVAVLLSYSSQHSFEDTAVYQHYAAPPNQFVLSIPLYTRYQSLLI